MSRYCVKCGKEVDPSWRVCPNCGDSLLSQDPTQPYQPTTYPQQGSVSYSSYKPEKEGYTYGLISVILAGIGFLLGWYIIMLGGIMLAIIGVIVGARGLVKDKTSTLSIIGIIGSLLVLGIMVFLWLIIYLLWIIF